MPLGARPEMFQKWNMCCGAGEASRGRVTGHHQFEQWAGVRTMIREGSAGRCDGNSVAIPLPPIPSEKKILVYDNDAPF